jgi:hypothetical protein
MNKNVNMKTESVSLTQNQNFFKHNTKHYEFKI